MRNVHPRIFYLRVRVIYLVQLVFRVLDYDGSNTLKSVFASAAIGVWIVDFIFHIMALYRLPAYVPANQTDFNNTSTVLGNQSTFVFANQSDFTSFNATLVINEFKSLETGSISCFFLFIFLLLLLYLMDLFPLFVRYVLKPHTKLEVKKCCVDTKPDPTPAGRRLSQVHYETASRRSSTYTGRSTSTSTRRNSSPLMSSERRSSDDIVLPKETLSSEQAAPSKPLFEEPCKSSSLQKTKDTSRAKPIQMQEIEKSDPRKSKSLSTNTVSQTTL